MNDEMCVRRKEKDVKEERSGGHFFDGFTSCKLLSATREEK